MLIRCLLILSILIIFQAPAFSDIGDKSITISSGQYVVQPGSDYFNPGNRLTAVGIRYYFHESWKYHDGYYISGNISTWESKPNQNPEYNSDGGTVYSLSVGVRTPTRLYVELSLGIGYLDNPDGSLHAHFSGAKYIHGYLSGNQQFVISGGVGYRINQTTSISIKWLHFSNCYQLCGLDDKYKVNVGRDFRPISIEYTF